MTDLWFRRFRGTAGSDVESAPVLCFPHAGGTAGSYYRLARLLAPSVEVVAVQYPGRQDRRYEPVRDDLHRLADELADLVGAFADGRSVFFGHSMGAVVAYETARRLNAGPAALVVSGRKAPEYPTSERKSLLDDAGLLDEVRRLGAVDPRLLRRPEMLRAVLPSLRGDYRAIETYAYRRGPPLGCPIVALAGSADPLARVTEVRGWQAHTVAAFSMHVFPGGHFFIDDHLSDIAELVAAQAR